MAAAHDLAGLHRWHRPTSCAGRWARRTSTRWTEKRVQFIEGCAKASKIDEKTADKIFTTMQKFAGYGFVKGHSTAYALIAYQCAWLKAHYPAEFMAATMTSEMSDSGRILTLIEESRRLKIELLPPDVNRSEWKFTIEDGQGARRALEPCATWGRAPSTRCCAPAPRAARSATCTRLPSAPSPGRSTGAVLESLVQAGACDALGGTRASLFAGAAMALDHASAVHRERASGQSSLFGGARRARRSR